MVIRESSEGHQRVIRGPSEGHQRVIRGSSEGHQRVIRVKHRDRVTPGAGGGSEDLEKRIDYAKTNQNRPTLSCPATLSYRVDCGV